MEATVYVGKVGNNGEIVLSRSVWEDDWLIDELVFDPIEWRGARSGNNETLRELKAGGRKKEDAIVCRSEILELAPSPLKKFWIVTPKLRVFI
jgi:hypothetical protein